MMLLYDKHYPIAMTNQPAIRYSSTVPVPVPLATTKLLYTLR
jgi:hypothetical protein